MKTGDYRFFLEWPFSANVWEHVISCWYWLVVGVHGVRHVSADHEGEWRRLLEGGEVGGGGGEAAENELCQVGLSALSAPWSHLQETGHTVKNTPR